jgi:lipopolysaccharide export system protein LptA
MKLRVPLLALVALAAAGKSSAQSCTLVNPAGADVLANDIGLPTQTAIIKHGELLCPGGKYIAADEIAAIEISGTYTLNQHVRYRDGDKVVTADFGQYFKRTSLLQVRGNVVVTDTKTGSVLSSPQLEYYQVSATNKISRVVTLGGRARAVMKGKPGTGRGAAPPPAPNAKDSTIVDADVIEIIGDKTFKGTGSAIITRTDMKGYGNFVEYDQDRGDMQLLQNARLEGDKYKLTGDTIRALGAEGEQIREVRASRDAILIATDVRVESPFLRIFLDSGAVNRLVATRPASRGAPVSLPRVLSPQFNMSADSIDALAPGQILQRVDAIGHAFGERLDTLPPPAAAKELPNVLTNDWLRGDTIHAVFTDNPDAKPRAANDTSRANDRVLEQIVALGKSASSAIRMQQPKDTTWRIFYTLADKITVTFAKGAILNVTQEGDVHGVYLTPQGAAAPVRPKRGGQ